FIAAGTKMLFHEAAYPIPLGLTDPPVQTSIRDDLHDAVRELNVDQHPVVVFGIPDLEESENLQRPGSGAYLIDDVQRRQRGLDRKTDLAGVGPLGAPDCLLDGIERGLGKPES